MIKWFFKYGVVLYVLNTILLSIGRTYTLASIIFICIMVVFGLLILINPKQIKLVIFHKSFRFLLILNLVNIFYWLSFHNFSDIEAGKYLIARFVQFSLISFAIVHNYDYFKKYFLKHVSYVILGVVILGLIIDPFIFKGRYEGVMWNPNTFSSFTSMAFAALFLMKETKTRFAIFVLLLLFIISLSTGSRDVLVAFFLVFLFKYGLSIRNMIYALLALGFYLFTVTFQLDTSINRFSSQGLLNDRLLQYQYAYETILQQPFFGFGLDKYAYINPDIVPHYLSSHVIAAHNGYLAILVQYGLLFGLPIIGIIFYKFIYLYIKIDKKDPELLSYLYISFYVIIASVYETFITGINEFHTILFWFSLAFLSFSVFKKKYGY